MNAGSAILHALQIFVHKIAVQEQHPATQALGLQESFLIPEADS